MVGLLASSIICAINMQAMSTLYYSSISFAVIVFSPSGKPYQYASHNINRTIAMYRREAGLNQPSNPACSPRIRTMELWRNENEELRRSIQKLEMRLENLAGAELSVLSIQELKQLERQLKTGIERIRSRMRRIISENISLLKRKVLRRFLASSSTVSSFQSTFSGHKLHSSTLHQTYPN